ncbi:Alpha/Beta hydrolase protein [Penicillium brevicompactum]|uniref:Alpha/Beta hydrolase protein n=1 Tax=Penicillium brevicompactum TaxID=5074 RepID=A0A9W9QQE1_PENBR|nr:Alpha/Beta hydrolase protein [Penicillium brevicompactum]
MSAIQQSEVFGLSADAGLGSIAIAARGNEITGLDIFRRTTEDTDITRVEALIAEMNADQPTGGTDLAYGDKNSQHLRFWKSQSPKAPIILYVHGGSWRIGTNLDSIGSAKVNHLVAQGYAFASVNYSLIPSVTVKEQVQEVADSVGYLARNAAKLNIDPDRVILMGHSSGAHVVTLLGTDPSYLTKADIDIRTVRAVISLDGSNYNAPAEIVDSPGPVADNMVMGLGTDTKHLQDMSPTYNARAPNAGAFLLLHAQRNGDIRQAVELSRALEAAGTDADLHVFEGEWFEGHVQILLRLGNPEYPATAVMDKWLEQHVPFTTK